MTTRVIGADTFTLLYDGSLRMVGVQKNGATIAEFAYDGDGHMVVSSIVAGRMGSLLPSYRIESTIAKRRKRWVLGYKSAERGEDSNNPLNPFPEIRWQRPDARPPRRCWSAE